MKKLIVILSVIIVAVWTMAQSVTITVNLTADQKAAVKLWIRSQATLTNSVWFGVVDPSAAQIKAAVETNAAVKLPDFASEAKRTQINTIAGGLSGQSFDGLLAIAAVEKHWGADVDLNSTKMNLITNIIGLSQSASATKLANAVTALQ